MFSRGLAFKEQGEWNSYFYDDAILEVDRDLGRVVAALEEHGLLEQTLLIIGSDHAMAFDQLQRVPLLMRFPGGEMAGRIQENVQGLDVAPTILDYLGLPQPEWMAGQSLLSAALEERVIFGAGVGPLAQNENSIWVVDPQRSKAPFYQFGTISLIDCNAWYELDLVTGNVSRGEVTGHTAPCPEQAMLSSAEAFALMVAYLKRKWLRGGGIGRNDGHKCGIISSLAQPVFCEVKMSDSQSPATAQTSPPPMHVGWDQTDCTEVSLPRTDAADPGGGHLRVRSGGDGHHVRDQPRPHIIDGCGDDPGCADHES